MHYTNIATFFFFFLFEFIYKDVSIYQYSRISNIIILYYDFLEIENEKLKYHH